MLTRIRPLVSDPYPDNCAEISHFRFRSRLELGRDPETLAICPERNACYMTLADYTVDFMVGGDRREITVPKGMLTDLTSVPQLFRNIIGRVGPHLEAAIVHDYLYIAWQLLPGKKPCKRDWRFANRVMFAGLDAANVGWVSRTLIRVALSAPCVSWPVYKGRDDGRDGLGLFVSV